LTWTFFLQQYGTEQRYGDRSPLGPKQNDAIFSVHLNRQDCLGGLELLGPYSPISWDDYPRDAIFSVHLNRQDCLGGLELLGPYSPISWDDFPVCRIANSGCGRYTLFVIVIQHGERRPLD
jgi:hypothetical protein